MSHIHADLQPDAAKAERFRNLYWEISLRGAVTSSRAKQLDKYLGNRAASPEDAKLTFGFSTGMKEVDSDARHARYGLNLAGAFRSVPHCPKYLRGFGRPASRALRSSHHARIDRTPVRRGRMAAILSRPRIP